MVSSTGVMLRRDTSYVPLVTSLDMVTVKQKDQNTKLMLKLKVISRKVKHQVNTNKPRMNSRDFWGWEEGRLDFSVVFESH